LILCPLTGRSSSCDLYPIALPAAALSNAASGTILTNLLQGTQPANFGWLSWGGSPGEPALVTSLTPPGNASTFVNPDDVSDHQVSAGDWVRGKPGVSNSGTVRDALEALKSVDITVPVWDQTRGSGEHAAYRVSAFARVRLLDYHLPQQNRITAQFLEHIECGTRNLAPMANAGPDLSINLPALAILNGTVTDDGLPPVGSLTQFWSQVTGPGPVAFADSNAPVTLAAFPLPGTYVLRLTATDSELSGSDEATVVVDRENHPPVVFSQSVTNAEDNAVTIILQSSDPDGDALTNVIVSPPNFGTLTGVPPNLTYQPNADYNGPDSFTFKASDGTLDSALATVTITNQPVNDAPVADAQSAAVPEDGEAPITLSGSDVEGSPLSYSIPTFPTNGVLPSTATTSSIDLTPITMDRTRSRSLRTMAN
jgi:hypothetical protein